MQSLVEIDVPSWRKHKNVLGWCMPVGDKVTSERIAIQLRHLPQMRLRRFDELMGTMIHELTHIVHGAHNAAFYRLMDELKREWSDRGLVNERGLLQGCRLSHGSLQLSKLGARAEPGGSILGGGVPGCLASGKPDKQVWRGSGRGRKLGGARWAHLSPQEAAARAAERRAADAKAGFGDEEILWPASQARSTEDSNRPRQFVSLGLADAFGAGIEACKRLGKAKPKLRKRSKASSPRTGVGSASSTQGLADADDDAEFQRTLERSRTEAAPSDITATQELELERALALSRMSAAAEANRRHVQEEQMRRVFASSLARSCETVDLCD